jgi:Bacterial protein of unknown function (DUF899)
MFPRAADDDSPGPPGGQTALLPLAEGPCPSCTALLDQLDGAAEHAGQRVNLAVAAKAPLERLATFAAERGWRRLRLLSSASATRLGIPGPLAQAGADHVGWHQIARLVRRSALRGGVVGFRRA